MYNPPEYLDATENIGNLITAVRNGLQLWLDIHTNAEAWALEWALDEEWNWLLKNQPIVQNKYFSFDLKYACLEIYAQNNLSNMYKCKLCGSLWDAGFEDCDCENQEYDDNNYEQLTNDDLDSYVEWLEEMNYTEYIPDYVIQEAMETKGFETYQKALKSTIQGIVDDVKDAIKMFDEAQDNEELLSAALAASSILHVNGSILEDYGDRIGLDYQTVCLYRDNGITALFDKQDIESFLFSDELLSIG